MQLLGHGTKPTKAADAGAAAAEGEKPDEEKPTASKKKTKKKKGDEEEEEQDSSQAELDADSEEVPEGEDVTQRARQLFLQNKGQSRKYDEVFDTYYHLDEQMQDYEQIRDIFKRNKIKMVDETKNPLNLKNAIFMQPGPDIHTYTSFSSDKPDNNLGPERMNTKATRYPGISDLLPCGDTDGKADKKKKKK